MDEEKRERVEYLLKRYNEETPPESVQSELVTLFTRHSGGSTLLRQLTLEKARQAIALIEDALFYTDAEWLHKELELLEDEAEAKALSAGTDRETLEAHLALFALLPPEADSTQRRRRVLALALAESYPERAATFIADYNFRYETISFWGGFRRRLFKRLKKAAPVQALLIADVPGDAQLWLWEMMTIPGADPCIAQQLIAHVLTMEMPIELSLPETFSLVDSLGRQDIPGRIELLCLLALSGARPVEDRTLVLQYLMTVGKSLSESERIRLAEAIRKDGIVYLRAEDRRAVLKRLANFTRHCHPEIRREIRILRAMALLIHLHPCRLTHARKWAHAYDKRFQKRLQAIQQEHAFLVERASILVRAIDAQKSGMETGAP